MRNEFKGRINFGGNRVKSSNSILLRQSSRSGETNHLVHFSPDNEEMPNSESYVRVSREELNQEVKIYEWRKNCHPNLVGIENFSVVSCGSSFNPHALIRVKVESILQKFSQLDEQLTLTRIIFIMKQLLEALKILINKFEPFLISDSMIFLTEEGVPKIWLMEKYEVNPNNSIYLKETKTVCTEKQSLLSFHSIFERKCLQTKLSASFFQKIRKETSIQGVYYQITIFQKENKFYCPQISQISGNKNSKSNNLLFSQNCNKRRKKRNIKSQSPFDANMSADSFESEEKIHFREKNLSLENKNFARFSLGSNWKFQEFSNIFSQRMGKPKLQEQKMRKIKSHEEKFCSEASSLLFSKTFKEEDGIHKSLRKSSQRLLLPLKISFSSKSTMSIEQKMEAREMEIPQRIPETLEGSRQLSIKINNNVMDGKISCLESQIVEEDEDDPTTDHPFLIMSKNGWSMNLIQLSEGPLKKSEIHGKDIINRLQNHRQLTKLERLGKEVIQSVNSESIDEEQGEEQ